jgi:cytochrome c oxidase subunit 3
MSTLAINTDNNPNSHKAQRFTIRLALVSISMTFAGFTSYYIIYKAKETWSFFEMPSIFWMSTLIIGLSSMAVHMAHLANKKDKKSTLVLGLLLTFLLGVSFCISQWLGYKELMSKGIFFSGSGNGNSIFYVLTGGHALHLIGGLLVVSIALVRSILMFRKGEKTSTYLNKESDKLFIRTDLITVYWHFMGFLWLYLFIFLYINH